METKQKGIAQDPSRKQEDGPLHSPQITLGSAQERRANEDARLRPMFDALATVVGPASALTALLYYFGWVRTRALWAEFGIDHSTLGFGTQDYLLRSIAALFVPLSSALIIALLLLLLHLIVRDSVENQHHVLLLRLLTSLAILTGSILLVFGIGAIFMIFRARFLLTPLSLVFGPGLIIYGTYIRETLSRARADKPIEWSLPWLAKILVVLLVSVNVFWSFATFADATGRGEADRMIDRLITLPKVIVYSERRLDISAPGVSEASANDLASAYPFHYEGLRLLIQSGGKFFLLPEGWSRAAGSVIILRDDPRLRLEMRPGGSS